MNFTPLHDRVLVRRTESDEKTAGGLIIPDSAKEKPQEGEVVSVGNGAVKDNGDRAPMAMKKPTPPGRKVPMSPARASTACSTLASRSST